MDDLATVHALVGLIAAVLASFALLRDRRRMRRSNPDAVGFMPWTTVFFWALFVAVLLLGLAGREWLAG